MKKEKGITLISLVVIITVTIILSGITLNMVIGDNSIIKEARQLNLLSKYSDYKESVGMILKSSKLYISGESLSKYIVNIEERDINNFVIVGGELFYIGNNEEEKQVAKKLGIEYLDKNALDEKAIREIIIPYLQYLNGNEEILQGGITKLYDKNNENAEKWHLAIEYNNQGNELARYGDGYYLIKTGENSIDGKEYILTNNYALTPEGNIVSLSSNYEEWSINSTLAVVDGLVLNIDPTNLSTGNWDGITKHGDVEYSSSDKALLFNENSTINPDGQGGYLEFQKSGGIDFSDGFTFEFYGNLSRLKYNNGYIDHEGLGMFSRLPSLTSNPFVSMRFGQFNYSICKFNASSSWYNALAHYRTDAQIRTDSTGGIITNNALFGYDINEDFYLTFVYTANDTSKSSEYQETFYDDYMKENGVDKVEYYVNGELFGYTYYGHDSYRQGLSRWNGGNCPFFLGVCPLFEDAPNQNLYYLKGKVYSSRIYTRPTTKGQVIENMNMTKKYHSSF